MNSYLIVYDREDGEIIYLRRFGSAQHANRNRFIIERSFTSPRFEIVVLGAESLAQCRRTHARYFLTIAEIAARI